MRARFFGPTASTARTTERLLADASASRSDRSRSISGTRVGGRRVFAEHGGLARAGDPHRRAALPRLGGVRPAHRFHRQRQRNAEPAARPLAVTRPSRRSSSARPTRCMATSPTSCRLSELGQRLELPDDHRYHGGHRHVDVDRRLDPLAVRRLQGGGRPAGAGVRPLLRDADGLLPGRLPDRPQSRRREAARLPLLSDALHDRRRSVHRLRLRGQAGPGQHPLRRPGRGVRCVPPGSRGPAAVYNIGGGRESNCSMLEAIDAVRADRRARARLDAVRAEPDRRSSLVDLRPRAVPARLPGVGHHLRRRDDRSRRSIEQNAERWLRCRDEAVGRDPGPQRGGVDRARRSRDRGRARARRRSTTRSS